MTPPNFDPIVTLVPERDPRPVKSRIWPIAITASVLFLGVGIGGWLWWTQRGEERARNGKAKSENHSELRVEVITPRKGGIERLCVQPGTVEPIQEEDVYAKVSGFLAEQPVDIGTRVKVGQLLAVIAVPELDKQVERDAATLEHQKAKVDQADARILAAEAEAKAALVSITVTKTLLNAKVSYRKFRQKQLARLTELNRQEAIELKVVDESQDQYESSVEAEAAAREAIAAAEQKAEAAAARVIQVKADLAEAKAAVNVAAAELERSKVLQGYTRITSPYDGVITKRNFHPPSAFIRSADSGGDRVPLLAVERTDYMRIIVQVPDRDVPYVEEGLPAEVKTDALPGQILKATISRMAKSEDAATRTMRTEVDVPNTNGRLRRGMYGQVTLKLTTGNAEALTIPSAALLTKAGTNQAAVRVVRDGKVKKIDIRIGADNGDSVEVLEGLAADDRVIVKANGPLDDGTPATNVTAATARSKP